MQVFFFPHPAERGPHTPGRYPFAVRAAALRRVSARFAREVASDRIVHVDGLGPDRTASNVDPNVLSERIPWFLTFCKVGGEDSQRVFDVKEQRQLPRELPGEVALGDLILFGWSSGRQIAIDTVLCVGGNAVVPVESGAGRRQRFALRERFAEFRTEVARVVPSFASVRWPDFVRTDDFRLNLVDSLGAEDAFAALGYERRTNHQRSTLAVHRMTIGRWGNPPEAIEGEALLAAFMRGEGFNCLPRLNVDAALCKGVDRTHPGLFHMRLGAAPNLPTRAVSRLTSTLAEDVLGGIFTEANELVFGRLEWTRRSRYLSDAAVAIDEVHRE